MQKIVKYFNSIVLKTVTKLKNKTNNFFGNNSEISNFNKIVITFISLLFFYLFYLSIPVLYNKSWVQTTIESKLSEEFKINFSTSSDISYKILPKPHFLVKNSKIFKNNNQSLAVMSEIKKLKVFISQSNFFNKEKLTITEALIDEGNFFVKRNDLRFLNTIIGNEFSNKEIKIINSNIFFKDNEDEAIAIIKISKAFLFYDNLKIVNLFNLRGEVFKIPFIFDLIIEPFPSGKKEININARKLKLNLFNIFTNKKNSLIEGLNIISVLNSKIHTQYYIKNNLITFVSDDSREKNSNTSYKGNLLLKPFDLKLDVNLRKQELSKLFNIDSIVGELVKTKLLFNEKINSAISINIDLNKNDKIFQSSIIKFNIIGGKINFDQTKLINKKIGYFEVNNSDLYYKNEKLILNTDILIEIQNSDKLFSFLQTPKKDRKLINKIYLNLDYDFLMSQINLNSVMINDEKSNDEIRNVIIQFNDNNDYNLNKSRRIFNKFLSAYVG